MTYIRRLILAFVLSCGLAPAFAQVPAAVPALPDTERRTSYVISGTTCACAVNFALYGDSTDYQNWVEVFINGVRYDYNDATHGWTITSPSGSLASLARPITNAVLTFNAVQTGTVQIVGARRPRRASQFNENAGVSARNINQVITDIISQNREIWDKTNDMTGRGIFAPPGESLSLLASAASRASKVLGFDALGNVTTYSPASAVTSAASVTFVQNGTGATATTIDALLRTIVVTPEMFGAQCGLAFDSTAAIQRAINYLASITAGTVQFSNCLYATTGPIVISTKGISLVGMGAATGNGTEIYFTPGAAGQCAISLTAGAGILSNAQIRNLSIRSPDTTTYKIGVCASDASVTTIRDVFIYGFNGGTAGTITGAASSGAANEIRLTIANASTIYATGWAVAVSGVVGTTEANFSWPITIVDGTHIDLKGSTFTNAYVSGGTAKLASTAMQTFGREFFALENVSLNGDIGLRISHDPNVGAGLGAMDQSNFYNMEIHATSTSCNVMVDDGVAMNSTKWTGTQSWIGGKSGFCWRDKSNAAISEQISLDNVRSEQKTASGGWYFDIQPNSTTYSFRINNLLAADRNGIRARNIANLQIDNPHFIDATASCLDINATVQSTSLTGVYAVPGATSSIVGQPYVTTGPIIASGCLPIWGHYSSTNGPNNFGSSIALVAGTGVGDTNYTILSSDRYVYINANFSAARTWTLPAASSVAAGVTIWMQDARNTVTSTNTLTIQRAGADTINTALTSIVVNNAKGGIALVSDGVSNWGSPVQNVATGGTGLESGTSGGIPYYAATARMASSAALPANAFVLGGGAGSAPTSAAITGLVLGNGASAPSAYAGTSCTNQFASALSASGAATCNSAVVTVKKQVFTTSGTYTPSTGMLYTVLECVGGGGGGGSASGGAGNSFTGGGGGSGGYSRLLATAATIGASKTVTIGGGGNGGASGSNNGAAGADSCFTATSCVSGQILAAKGGSGGLFGSVAQVSLGGAGGVAGTGDITAPGNVGGGGIYFTGVTGVTLIATNSGAGSAFGGGATAPVPSGGSITAGNAAAANTGGGGSGGDAITIATNVAGGNGGSGLCIATDYNSQ